MIRALIMENIKGQEGIQPLTGRDIIIGTNGSGKTTRMQTLGLSTLGYVPGKGKTAADTFELASADTMVVGLKTDEFEFTRNFKKTSKMDKNGNTDVKISQSITVSPSKGESTNTQKEQRIKAEIGDFPAMLDFQSFLALTDNKKRDFIYNLNGSSFEWDREKVENSLRDKVLRDELSEDMREYMESCFADVMTQYKSSASVQDGLLAMKEYAKAQLSYWKKEKITADGASKKLTELKNRGAETDRDLAVNQEKLKAIQSEYNDCIRQIAAGAERNKMLEEKQKELEAVRLAIKSLEEADTEERLNELAEQIKAISDSIENKPNFEEDESDIQKGKESATSDKLAIDQSIRALEREVTAEEEKIKAYSEIIEKIESNKGHCAFSPTIVCGQDFSGYIGEMQENIDSAYSKIDIFKEKIREQQLLRGEAEDRLLEARKKEVEFSKRLKEHSDQTMKNLTELQKLKEEQIKLQNTAPLLTSKQDKEREICAYLEENNLVDTTLIEEAKNSLDAQIRALTATIDEQKKVRNDLKNIKANIIDSKTAHYQTECWKQIASAVGQGGIQGELVKEMLDPIKREVDKKLQSIGLDREFFFITENERDREVFSFGWLDGNTTRHFDALSQGEQMLLLIALMTTIIERNNPPIKVLAIDNINDLDTDNLNKVLKGLMIAGENMDNIILSGVVTPTMFKDEEGTMSWGGWAVWNLNE